MWMRGDTVRLVEEKRSVTKPTNTNDDEIKDGENDVAREEGDPRPLPCPVRAEKGQSPGYVAEEKGSSSNRAVSGVKN